MRKSKIIISLWSAWHLGCQVSEDAAMLAEHEILEHFSKTKYDEVLVRNYLRQKNQMCDQIMNYKRSIKTRTCN